MFPCRHDKTPHTPNGVLDATTDPEKIRAWWTRWPGANVATDVGGAGMMVLDLDPGHDMKELEKNAGPIPNTRLRARTPRQGEHLYFLLPSDELVSPSSSKVAPHVDVRSFHSYVLLPPSETKDGAYTWEADGEAAHRTDEMVRVANLAREKHRDRNTWTIEPDLRENVALATAWLQVDARPAIEGTGGDLTTYSTAAMCKSYGLSEGTALELMWEHWWPRCDPPWLDEEGYAYLAVKVANGYSYNTSPPGNVTPAYKVAGRGFSPLEEDAGDGTQVTTGRFRFVDREGMEAIKPPDWLVPDALPEDAYAMLVGASGTYKTFIALDMALTVATGGGALVAGEWRGLWRPPRHPGPVLFAAGEGRSSIRKRVAAWEAHHLGGARARDFMLADPVPHVTASDVEDFIEGALRYYEGYSLVVLDTVARAMQGVNTSADEHATAFTRLCDVLRHRLGCTVLALHHTGHEAQDRARGSSAFLGDPDTILVAERVEDRLTRLSMPKQKDAEAWEKPQWCKMELVALGEGQDSLVATKGRPSTAARRGAEGEASAHLVDAFLLDVLRSSPLRKYSNRELSVMLAGHTMTDEDGTESVLGLGAEAIRRNRLPAVAQAGSGHRCQVFHDPLSNTWRYCPTAAQAFGPL